jgi:hypothetical protein
MPRSKDLVRPVAVSLAIRAGTSTKRPHVGFFWHIKSALRASHTTRTLIEEIIRAIQAPDLEGRESLNVSDSSWHSSLLSMDLHRVEQYSATDSVRRNQKEIGTSTMPNYHKNQEAVLAPISPIVRLEYEECLGGTRCPQETGRSSMHLLSPASARLCMNPNQRR